MNTYFKRIFFLGCFGIFGSFAVAQPSFDPMNIPKLAGYVNDFSQVLPQSDKENLNIWANNYDQQTSNQFVTVLFPNRNGNDLFSIGMKLFNENQIGQAGKNNGLLMLIATEEKKIRIIVGYGLEGDLPDALVSRIIEKDIRPLINSGDFVGAITTFNERCSQAITNQEAKTLVGDTSSPNQKMEDGFWIFGLILGFILASLIKQKRIPKTAKKIAISFILGGIILLLLWLGSLILFGAIAGLAFGLTGFLPGRGGRGFGGFGGGGFGGGGFGGGGFGGGGFSGGGGSSGGGGAGD